MASGALTRARIHRGSREIGGNCVELESEGCRLVLDIGRPLGAGPEDDVPLPAIAGLGSGDGRGLLGVVVSHPHIDHWGLLPQVHRSVPVYMGAAASRILEAAAFFSPRAGLKASPSGFLQDGRPLQLGPFRLTPYLVDHSAYDSYALLVEAGGRRLLYSGDLRAHGRKPGTFRRLLEDLPRTVDALLLEATQVTGTGEDGRPTLSEADLELALAERFRATDGLGVVLASAQNLDRLVTTYRAARRVGRTLVIDLYTAALVRATRRPTMPQPGTHNVRVYIPNRQRLLVKQSGEFERTHTVARHRVYPEELHASSSEFALLAQTSTLVELRRAGCLDGATAAWSMWPGYLNTPSGKLAAALLAAAGVRLALLHASGHAAPVDLCALAEAVQARRVVPIHTAAPEHAAAMLRFGVVAKDGEWWEA